MALRDWLHSSGGSAAEVIAVIAVEPLKSSPKTATTATTATATMPDQKKKANDLPADCPLMGGPVPAGCRFHRKIFKRLLAEGALQAGGSCPLRKVCAL